MSERHEDLMKTAQTLQRAFAQVTVHAATNPGHVTAREHDLMPLNRNLHRPKRIIRSRNITCAIKQKEGRKYFTHPSRHTPLRRYDWIEWDRDSHEIFHAKISSNQSSLP